MWDKVLHFGISGVIALVVYEGLFAFYPQMNSLLGMCLIMGISLIPGILKEITDSEFDMGDLVADICGIISGIIAGKLIN